MRHKKQLAIYISSYDGCSDLWDNFFKIFDKYWKNCSYNVYLINNEINYKHNDVITVNTGPEINWFNRTIKSLEEITEEYILFFLEDYFFSKEILEDDIEEIIDFMKKNNVFYYQLSERSDINKKEKRILANSKYNYPISLQPAIWNKNEFLKVLKEINGKSPWDFEYYYLNKYPKDYGNINGAYYDSRDILGYKNGILRGKWFRKTLKFYHKLGIDLDIGNRDKLSVFSELKYNIACWCSNHLSNNLKEKIKKFLKKVKFDYLK